MRAAADTVIAPLGTGRGHMARVGPTSGGLVMLFVLLLAAIPSLAPLFALRVTPAGAPPERFSAERAMTHLPLIAREPHPAGSDAQARVRDYLIQELAAIGLQPEVQQASGV